MKNYILIKKKCTDRNGKELSALESAKILLNNNTWPLWDTMRNRKAIQAGDRLAIYLAGSSEVVATAKVLKIEKWNSIHANRYPLTLDGTPEAMMILAECSLLTPAIKVKCLLQKLGFINHQTPKWGVAFMGGCRAVTDTDFDLLTSRPAIA